MRHQYSIQISLLSNALIFRLSFLLVGLMLLFATSLKANQLDLASLEGGLQEEWDETNEILKDKESVAAIEPLDAKHPSPSKYVNSALWKRIQPFLMAGDHPIKAKLDQIFLASRALCDLYTLEAAGFTPALPQHHTQIIVTKHPELAGYVIKAYLDVQDYHSGKPEYYFWRKRIKGARLIDKAIQNHGYGHILKVPRKWMYLLPDEPSPPPTYLRKMFILVEEDMNIYDDQTNEALWGSSFVTKELLDCLYNIITELGLFDCAKPANCPFSKDGKVAFVDTQSYHAKRVKYEKLTPYLSPSMQRYWKKLAKRGKASSESHSKPLF